MKLKNYALALLNMVIAGLPILLTWDPIIFLCYFGGAAAILALTAWNVVGDVIAIFCVFHGDLVPPDALIRPALDRYFKTAADQGLLRADAAAYYATSGTPYFIPLSGKRVMLSLALEDWLLQDGAGRLFQAVPREAYDAGVMASRKVLLLSLFCYVLVIRLMELWAIFFAVAIKAIMALAMMITSGAFFEGFHEMLEATLFGCALGVVIVKVNDLFNFLQDKVVNWIMDSTMKSSFDFLQQEGAVARRGLAGSRAIQQQGARRP